MTAYRSGCAAVLCITSMKCRFAWHRMKALVRKRHGCWRPSHMRRGITQHFCGRPFDWISYALSTSKNTLGVFYALAAFSIAWTSIWFRMTLHKSCTTGLKATSGASTFLLLSHRMIFDAHSPLHKHTLFLITQQVVLVPRVQLHWDFFFLVVFQTRKPFWLVLVFPNLSFLLFSEAFTAGFSGKNIKPGLELKQNEIDRAFCFRPTYSTQKNILTAKFQSHWL